MNEIPTRLRHIVYICRAIYAHKWAYIVITVVIFIITTILLAHAGIIPDVPSTLSTDASAVVPIKTLPFVQSAHPSVAITTSDVESPIKIVIPSIHLSASIKNPNTTNARILDGDLLSGAVRYPRSAMLGEQGNVILFGHSSYLPIVLNQAYKTFNGIQNLHEGSLILVHSSSKVYEYAVKSVKKESATVDSIALAVRGKVLTLSTCNVFGKKSSRFIVTASFVKSYPIVNNS